MEMSRNKTYEIKAEKGINEVLWKMEEALKIMSKQAGMTKDITDLFKDNIEYLKLLKRIFDDAEIVVTNEEMN